MLELNNKNTRFLSRMGAQGVYGQALFDMKCEKKSFRAISADLTYASGLRRMKQIAKEDVINVGIAEQNMIAIAAGLSEGNCPSYTSSWATFATYRCADQIRTFAGIMKKNIKVVGMSSGMHTLKFGASHYGLGDITLMRSISNIIIVSPCDGWEIYRTIYAAYESKEPFYIRLTGGNTLPIINDYNKLYFEIGKANILRKGKDIALIGCGTILANVLEVADKLFAEGIDATVVNMHTIRPIDEEVLEECMRYDMIVTIEEHSIIGGLGGAVGEYLSKKRNHPKHIKIGVDDFYPIAGEYEYLLKQCKLDVDSLYERIVLEISL